MVAKYSTGNLFNDSELFFDNCKIRQLLDKLAEQEKKLQVLQQNLLKERKEKESIQTDFEHILNQLNKLQQEQLLTKKIDITYS